MGLLVIQMEERRPTAKELESFQNWQGAVKCPSGLELAFLVDLKVMKHRSHSVGSGMGMADGHEEWDRAASHVRGGVDSERDCYRTLLSVEMAVVVEIDDVG